MAEPVRKMPHGQPELLDRAGLPEIVSAGVGYQKFKDSGIAQNTALKPQAAANLAQGIKAELS